MEKKDFIAMAATLAAGAMLASHARAANGNGISGSQDLVAMTDTRLVTLSTPGDHSVRTGVVLDDSR